MGDIRTLSEKAQEDYDEQKAQELEKRLRKNQFTLEDFLEQMGQIRKMGGIGKLLGMMPRMNSRAMQNVNVEQSERDFVQMEAIIQSMTREEREKDVYKRQDQTKIDLDMSALGLSGARLEQELIKRDIRCV